MNGRRHQELPRSCFRVWFIVIIATVFISTIIMVFHLHWVKDSLHDQMLSGCFKQSPENSTLLDDRVENRNQSFSRELVESVENRNQSFSRELVETRSSHIHPPNSHIHPPKSRPAPYKSNGFLLIFANGGLNQMRAAICDMVVIAKFMKVTLVIPELDKTSFWTDPSNFSEIFDTDHFISSLEDQVHIVRQLPELLKKEVANGGYYELQPQNWSPPQYYSDTILPLIQKHTIVRLNKTECRLANNHVPLDMQKMRCYTNYHALRFTPRIEELGRKMIQMLHKNGPFVVLHLRYEMDMLAYSGCTHGLTKFEVQQVTKMRYDFSIWKEKDIKSSEKRKNGLCPLTPKETVLILRALGFNRDTQIYIASGVIYGGDKRMAPLYEAYPNVVRKETLLMEDLIPFQNRSSQMASLDYVVALASDVFIPTYYGNMGKVLEGHRRYLSYLDHGPRKDLDHIENGEQSLSSSSYLGYRPTILLDRKKLVELLDSYESKQLDWNEFAREVSESHKWRMGNSEKRRRILRKPKEEDYFYSNPQECMCDPLPNSTHLNL